MADLFAGLNVHASPSKEGAASESATSNTNGSNEEQEGGAASTPSTSDVSRPVVFCGPSGAGKGTMIDLLMKRFPNDQFGFSVSHTTRGPREGEQDGVHYNFTTVDAMKAEISDGKFIEHAEVHGRYYGTSVSAVESVQSSGKVCILDIDVQGVKNVKKSSLAPYYIFIAPPSMEQLEARLRGRGTEKEEDIQTRLGNAACEMGYGQTEGEFDFYVTNDDLQPAFERLATQMKTFYPDLQESVPVETNNSHSPNNYNLRRPLVFCGPSGAGKGTMIDLLMKRFPNDKFGFSVSHTTREPRDGEADGVHYNFTTVDKIKQEIADGKFIEHAEVHCRYYGTSVAAVENVQASGKVCILDIDVQGVKNVKQSPLDPYYVFIAPPSMEQLEKRLRGRGTEKEEDIQTRISNAAEEMAYGQTEGEFDLFLTNDDLKTSFEKLVSKIKELYPAYLEEVTVDEVTTTDNNDTSIRPIVFCGPSGAGKGTMIDLLMKRFPEEQFGFSVSHTTRGPREGEEDGVHYNFTTVDQIKNEIDAGKFIEYAEVHGRYYGTSVDAVESVQKTGKVCILDIDVQGVKNVKKSALKPYYIFIAPPSMDQLEKRLRGRGTEKEEDIQTRLGNAAQEMAYGQEEGEFDLYLTNGDLNTSFETLVSKVKSFYPNLREVVSEKSDSTGGGIRPIVFCGPSGAGKGTMIDLLMKRFPEEQFGFSVSHTTRGPREGEEDGVHYNFTTVDQIKQEITDGKFIEYAEVHGRYYGTSVAAVESVRSAGKVCILDIDIQGVKNVKMSALIPHFVFVAPPSMEQLEKRLRGRGTEKEEDIKTRLGNAAQEMSYGRAEGEFDFYLTNDSLQSALEQLVTVIKEWYPSLVEASTPAIEAAAAVSGTSPAASNSIEAPASPVKSQAAIAAAEAATPRSKVSSSATKKIASPSKYDGPSPLVDNDAAAAPPPLPQFPPETLVTPIKGGAMSPPTSVSIPPQDTLGSCIRSLDKFVARSKPKIPYDVPKKKRGQTDVAPVRVLTKLTGVNWLGAWVGATHYGFNYTSPYIGECVGAMNQLLDTLDDVTVEQQKLKDMEKSLTYQDPRQDLASEANRRRTAAVNKLIAVYVHLVATWSSYSNLQQAAAAAASAHADQNGSGATAPRDAGHSEPPVSSQLMCWAVDTAETMVAHGCFDASVATAAAANSTTPSRGSDPSEAHVSPIQQLSDAVCRVDLASEESELAALKFILTTGCRTCTTPVGHLSMLHGKDLLQLIRTAYHIYLKTGSEPNKTTARAALQQLVASVFQRMDVQDPLGIAAAGAKTIGMSGIRSLGTAAAAGGVGGAVPAAAAAKALTQEGPFDSPFVQKRPLVAMPGTPIASAKDEALQQFFNDHPEVKPAASTGTALQKSDAWYPSVAVSLDLTAKETAASAASTATAATGAASDDAGTAASGAKPGESSRSAPSASGVTKSNGTAAVPGAMTLDDMTSGGRAATFASPSHLDAFLVLRSLCKLSMKTLPDHMNVATSFPLSGGEQEDERTGGANGANGLTGVNPAMESKILALELLLYVLDHATPSAALFSTPSFSFAIRNYLCVSLLKNCTSNNTRIVALSLRLFIPIIRHFREGLKTEIEAFVTNVFFVILDSPNSTVEHKSLVVTLFQEICSCEDTLAEIFLNYDCDLSAVDLFHRIVTTLSRVASRVGGETDFSDRGVFSSGNHQSMALRQAYRELKLSAMRALRQVLASLYESLKVEGMDARFALGAATGADSITAMSGDGMSVYSGNRSLSSYDATAASSSSMIGSSSNHGGSTPKNTPSSDSNSSSMNNKATSSSSIVKMYDSKKKRREQEIEIYLRFNKKPAAGIKLAGDSGHLDATNPKEVAKFLHSIKEKVDKTQIGDYLGREPEFQGGFGVHVLHAYVDMLNFSDMPFDDAIRFFLSGFRLPGEAQKIDRIMEKFAERFCKQNPSVFPTADTAFILGFSVIMLNTDLHNPAIKEDRRMTKDGFRRNNRGICDGQDLPEDFLNGVFDRIKATPISLKEDDDARKKVDGEATSDNKTTSHFLFGNSHQDTEELNRNRESKFLQERDQIVRNTELILQQRRNKGGKTGAGAGGGSSGKQQSAAASSSARLLQGLPPSSTTKFVRTTDALKDDYVAPMFDVTWGPALAVFSTAVESTSDIQKLASYATDHELDLIYENAAEILEVSLNGFRLAICTAGLCGNDTARSAFVQSLYNFTRLGTHRLLTSRHIRCIQALLRLANDDGELLGDTWEHIFKALSEVNRLLQVHDELIRQERGRGRRPHHGRHGHGHHDNDDDSFSSNDGSDLYGGSDGDFALHEEDMDRRAIDEENAIGVYEAVAEGMVDKIFHRSSSLSNPAVKEFIFQLCRVSRMEIAGYGGHVGSRANAVGDGPEPASPEAAPGRKHQPIIYSLQQIVQVTHYNMESRSRLVFAEIWATVAAHLTSTALHANPAVTMYAVDSLRQLGLQFLQRDELGMFEFQRKFLRPYEAVMERSHESSTKELLLASVQQMIQRFGVSNDESNGAASSSVKRGTLRSGWKSVLIVLGLAAHDEDDHIAAMGYQTLRGLAIQTASLAAEIDTDGSNQGRVTASQTSLLLNEHFVDLVDSLLMYVSGPRPDLCMRAIGHLVDMASWLADESIPLPVMRKATHDGTEVQQSSSSAQDLELWWPILLGFSQNVGHVQVDVREKSLTTLVELIKLNFFPQQQQKKSGSGSTTSNQGAEGHVSLQTLRLIFKGVLLPALEHAETDAFSLYATPPLPKDFHRFVPSPAAEQAKKGTSPQKANSSSSLTRQNSNTNRMGLGRKQGSTLARKDSSGRSVDEAAAAAAEEKLEQQQQQLCWINTTLDQLLDSCVDICLLSMDAFESEDMIEEVLSLFNACLVSDSGALAVKGLQRLHTFLTINLGRDRISTNTWATVSHMLLRSLVVRSSGDDGEEAFGAEYAMLVGRKYIPSNATMIIGLLLCDDDYAASMGLNWYLFLTTGVGSSIKEWEVPGLKERPVQEQMVRKGVIPPSHSENVLYGRELLVKLMLEVVSNKKIANEDSKGTVHQLLKEETQSILTSFLEKEKALGPQKVLALKKQKQDALKVAEVKYFAQVVCTLLDGYNQLDDAGLVAQSWLCPMLSSLTQSNNDAVRKSVHTLVTRLFKKSPDFKEESAAVGNDTSSDSNKPTAIAASEQVAADI